MAMELTTIGNAPMMSLVRTTTTKGTDMDNLTDKRMADAADAMRDPARDHALAFVTEWAKRTGNDPHGDEAERVYEEAYTDACDAMSER